MISGKDVAVSISRIGRKTKTTQTKCYNCRIFKDLLAGNPKKLLKQIRMNPKSCSCSISTEIWLYDKSRAKPRRFDSLTCLARLRIVQNGDLFESHSNIYKDSFLNQGLGLVLYSLGADWCAKQGKPLHSSLSPSYDAGRVWRSKRLRKKYRVTWTGSRWRMVPRERP
jgi:hypothetical protein